MFSLHVSDRGIVDYGYGYGHGYGYGYGYGYGCECECECECVCMTCIIGAFRSTKVHHKIQVLFTRSVFIVYVYTT